jgi:hypothetical protein
LDWGRGGDNIVDIMVNYVVVKPQQIIKSGETGIVLLGEEQPSRERSQK